MTDVLLTYAWVRSSYCALKNLSVHGLKVTVADSSRIGMGQFSRYSHNVERYTSHYTNEVQFIDDLVEISKRNNSRLILPAHNETEVIARHRHRFSKEAVDLIPNVDHCALFNNKSDSYDFVESLGVPVPRRYRYESVGELRQTLEQHGIGRSVVKLLTGNSGKGVFYGANIDETIEIVEQLITEYNLSKERFPLVEEVVQGEGFGCSILYYKGEFVAHFTHKRLREKIETGGTSTLRESAQHAELEAATKRIFSSLGYNGLAMGEFKVCPRTGRVWFIEVNPRMWGSISLAVEAGAEFPFGVDLLYQRIQAAKSLARQRSPKIGWKARWLLGDFFVCLKLLSKFQIKEFVGVIKNSRSDSIDDFSFSDPLAFIGQVFYYVITAIKSKSFNAAEKGMLG